MNIKLGFNKSQIFQQRRRQVKAGRDLIMRLNNNLSNKWGLNTLFANIDSSVMKDMVVAPI